MGYAHSPPPRVKAGARSARGTQVPTQQRALHSLCPPLSPQDDFAGALGRNWLERGLLKIRVSKEVPSKPSQSEMTSPEPRTSFWGRLRWVPHFPRWGRGVGAALGKRRPLLCMSLSPPVQTPSRRSAHGLHPRFLSLSEGLSVGGSTTQSPALALLLAGPAGDTMLQTGNCTAMEAAGNQRGRGEPDAPGRPISSPSWTFEQVEQRQAQVKLLMPQQESRPRQQTVFPRCAHWGKASFT